MKINFLKMIKISFGCCISVLIADSLGLSGSTSAGVITLLSIQNTKRETLAIAGKRFLAFFAAIAAAYLSFIPLDFRVTAFGLFLFLFTFFCYGTGLEAGVSTNTVLVTHLWKARSFSPFLILNEFFLLSIGIAVAVLVNLYMPRILETIREDQNTLDQSLKQLLGHMASALEGAETMEESAFRELEANGKAALERAYRNMNNTLAVDMRYYVQYIEMRMDQCVLLKRIYKNLTRIQCPTIQAKRIARFMREIAGSLEAPKNTVPLLESLEKMRCRFRSGKLPVTRAEFETRAVLFTILIDLEYLLLAKKKFAESLTPWQISYFWGTKSRLTVQ